VLTAVTHRWSLPREQRDPKKAEKAAERFKAPLRVLDGALVGRHPSAATRSPSPISTWHR